MEKASEGPSGSAPALLGWAYAIYGSVILIRLTWEL
jgi:hypothetical protein